MEAQPDPTAPKSFLASKTNWVNALAIPALSWLVDQISTGNYPPEFGAYAAIALAAGNLVLRFLTTRPLKFF